MSPNTKPEFLIAGSPAHFKAAVKLFKEYAATLDFDLCFQDFDKELEDIEIQYNLPSGGLILIVDQGKYVGCAGVRKFDGKSAELKRMYVQPAYRGSGLGNQMMNAAIELAKSRGYERMLLDTLRSMKSALAVYRKFGFYEIPSYRHNPKEDVVYLERRLN